MKANQILRQAADVIEERGKLRDKPDGERSMARAVAAYNILYGANMTELEGWTFMSILKIARSAAGQPHLDDFTDLAGYAALAAECVSEAPTLRTFPDDETAAIRDMLRDSIVQSDGPVGGIDRTPIPGWKSNDYGAAVLNDDPDHIITCCRFPNPTRDNTKCMNCGGEPRNAR